MKGSYPRWPGFSLVVVAIVAALWSAARDVRSLEDDGIHDPTNPVVMYLQDPADAFNRLPADSAGNRVDWTRALRDGYIRPRSQLTGMREVEILDTDILMGADGSVPRVRFPHRAHTEWLDCANCHERPFVSQAGANAVTMGRILEGEYCGVCHGAVAFPLTECSRCHSVPWN